MGRAKPILVVAALLVMGNAAATEPSQAGPSSPSSPASQPRDCSPPCGYIDPTLSIAMLEKPLCLRQVGQAVDRTLCIPLPAVGDSVSFEGTVTWSWDITRDGLYPSDPSVPIVISFGGTDNNPTWMELNVEPATFTLDAATLAAPENQKLVLGDPMQPQLWFWYERPIQVTLTRTAEPTQEEVEQVADLDHIVKVHLKGRSNASGVYFREAFNVEAFRFDALGRIPSTPPGNDAPGVGFVALGLALVVAVATVRRRR